MKTRIKPTISFFLAAALLVNACPGLEAALRAPSPAVINHHRFLINQEKTRLEMETLNLQSVNSKPLLASLRKYPFLSRLLVRFDKDLTVPEMQAVPAWRPVVDWLFSPLVPQWPRIARGDALIVAAIAGAQAVFPGAAGLVLWGCGMVGSFGTRSALDQMAENRKRTKVLSRRGKQSMGMDITQRDVMDIPEEARVPTLPKEEVSVPVIRLVDHKDWFDKRGNKVDIFYDGLKQTYLKASKTSKAPLLDSDVTVQQGHTRYATTGSKKDTVDDLIEAAHPHTWVPGQMRPYWVGGENGRPFLTYRWLENSFGFNGDLEKLKTLFITLLRRGVEQDEMDNDAIRDFLGQWHYRPSSDLPPGDAPTLAGLMDFFHTQGFWFPSVKLALAVHASRRPRETPPAREHLEAWAHVFDIAFYHARDQIHLPAGKTVDSISAAELEAFIRHMQSILKREGNAHRDFLHQAFKNQDDRNRFEMVLDQMNEILDGRIDDFVNASVKAFAYNSLPYAVAHEIAPRFEGTIGATFLSTVPPPGMRQQKVIWAWGQPASVAFDEVGPHSRGPSDGVRDDSRQTVSLNAAFASDRRALQTDPASRWRIDLNSGIGEIMVLNHDGKRISIQMYSGPSNRPLDDAEIRLRRKDMHNPREVDPLPDMTPADQKMFDEQPMEFENRRIPELLKLIHAEYEYEKNDGNLDTEAEFARVLIQQRISDAIRLRLGVNERHLPAAAADRIWKTAEALSRAIWDQTRPEQLVLQQIEEEAEELTAELLEQGMERKADDLQHIMDTVTALLRDENKSLGRRLGRAAAYLLKTAALLPATLRDRLETAPYDIVFIGTEKSAYANRQFGADLAALLNLRVRSWASNDFLVEAIAHRHDRDGFLKKMRIDPKRTIVFFASDSAETFDTELAGQWGARLADEMFIMTGSRENRLADIVGRRRTFHYHNAISMEETHLAAYAGINLAYTELLTHLGENLLKRMPGHSLFHLAWTKADFKQSRLWLASVVNTTASRILGWNDQKEPVQSRDARLLNEQGEFYAAVVRESTRVWILARIYLLATVVIAGTGLATGLLSSLAGAAGLPFGPEWQWMGRILDWGIYSSLFAVPVFLMRLMLQGLNWKFPGRYPTPPPMMGFGGKTILVFDPYDYVWQFLSLFGRKAFALSYGINSVSFEGERVTRASDSRAPTANRRSFVILARPDADNSDYLKIHASSSIMLGKQAKSILTLLLRPLRKIPGFNRPISPHIVTYGTGSKVEPGEQKAWHRHLSYGDGEILPAGMPDHLARFYGSRIDAFKRLLAGGRIISTMAQSVGSKFPRFKPGETHPGTGSKTTGGPVLGDLLLPVIASLPVKVVRIEDPHAIIHTTPNPFDVVVRPLQSWTPELEGDIPQDFASQAVRAPTFYPVTERAPAAVPRSAAAMPHVTIPPVPVVAPRPSTPKEKRAETPAVGRDRIRQLLGTLPPRENLPKSGARTTLLMKRHGLGPVADVPWGHVLVEPHGEITFENDALVPERVRRVLKRIIPGALTDPHTQQSILTRPLFLYVDQVRGRAAAAQTMPPDHDVAGLITLDSDLMIDVQNDVPYAAETLFLELVEESRELLAGETDRFEREVQMLWIKISTFLTELNRSEQDGVLAYLRSSTVYDPEVLNLAGLYETALSELQKVVDEQAAGGDAPVGVGARMAVPLRDYVGRALVYEQNDTSADIPSDSGDQLTPQPPAAPPQGRILRFARVASLLALGLSAVLTYGADGRRPSKPVIHKSITAAAPAVPAQKPMDLTSIPILREETLSAADRKKPQAVQIRLAEQLLGRFVERLRVQYPELRDALAGPLSGPESVPVRLWNTQLGEQTKSGNIFNIPAGTTYNLNSLKKTTSPAPKEQPIPAPSPSRWWQKIFSISSIMLLGVTALAAAAPASPASFSGIAEVGFIAVKTAVHHTVRKGDTLEHLSRFFGTTPEAFKAANPEVIFNINDIYIGNELAIPGLEKIVYQVQTPALEPLTPPSMDIGPLDQVWMQAHDLFYQSLNALADPSPALLGIAVAATFFVGLLILRKSAPVVRIPVFARAVMALLVILQFVQPLSAMASAGFSRLTPLARILYQAQPIPRPVAIRMEALNSLEQTLFDYALAKKNLDDLKALAQSHPSLPDLDAQLKAAESRLAETVAAGERRPVPINFQSFDVVGLLESLVIRQGHTPASALLAAYVSEINQLLHASKKIGRKAVLQKIDALEGVRQQMVQQWTLEFEQLAMHRRDVEAARAAAAADPTVERVFERNRLDLQEMLRMARLRLARFRQSDIDKAATSWGPENKSLIERLVRERVDQEVKETVPPVAKKASSFADRPDKKDRKEELRAGADALQKLAEDQRVAAEPVAVAEPGDRAADQIVDVPVASEAEQASAPTVQTEVSPPVPTPPAPSPTRVGRIVERVQSAHERALRAHAESAVLEEIIGNYEATDLSGLRGNTFRAVVSGTFEKKPATPPHVWLAEWLARPRISEGAIASVLREGVALFAEYKLLKAMDDAATSKSKAAKARLAAFEHFIHNPPIGLESLAERLGLVIVSPDEFRATLPDRIGKFKDSLAEETHGQFEVKLLTFDLSPAQDADHVAQLQVLNAMAIRLLLTTPEVPPVVEAKPVLNDVITGAPAVSPGGHELVRAVPLPRREVRRPARPQTRTVAPKRVPRVQNPFKQFPKKVDPAKPAAQPGTNPFKRFDNSVTKPKGSALSNVKQLFGLGLLFVDFASFGVPQWVATGIVIAGLLSLTVSAVHFFNRTRHRSLTPRLLGRSA